MDTEVESTKDNLRAQLTRGDIDVDQYTERLVALVVWDSCCHETADIV